MTRLITDGAEHNDTALWKFNGGIGITTNPVRSGSYAYTRTGNYAWGKMEIPGGALSECYARVCFNSTNGTYANHSVMCFWKGDTALIEIYHSSDAPQSARLSLNIGGTGVAYSTHAFSNNVWHMVEAYVKMADTSGSVIVKVNGIVEIEYVGDTKPGADTDFNFFGLGTCYGFAGGYDDIALNSTSGSVNNSWCGDGHIEILKPNAEGDTLQWNPIGAASHWDCVDEIPPNSDTDYICSDSPGERDMVNLAAFTDTNKTVKFLWAEARVKDASATASKVKLGIKTSGSVFLKESDPLPSIYTTIKSDCFLVDPSTGNVWGKTAIDALQAVVESS